MTASPELQEEVHELPEGAVRTLGDPSVRLELHCIAFSHYCDRARWALRLLGLPYEERAYLPLAHVPGVRALLKRFKQGPGKPTASSKSPVVTPALAIYDAEGQPVAIVQNSATIARYASLRAVALAGRGSAPRPAHELYGPAGGLSLGPAGGKGRSPVVGSGAAYDAVAQLELRLSGPMGVETRRVVYHHLLPRAGLGGAMFRRNAGGGPLQRLLSPLVYWLCRLLLPRLLRVTPATAAAGRDRLLAEFDFFDELLRQRERQAGGKAAAAAAAGGGLPYYLCGPRLTAADVSLACLAGPVLGVPASLRGGTWQPEVEDLPEELRCLVQALRERPTGKYALELWRVHGPSSSRL